MTVKEWLTSVAASNQSTDKDASMMQNFLRRIGFPMAVCTCGIVYADGHGTLEAPPVPIQTMAQMMLSKSH